jgi:hypothetical protein
LIFNYLFFQITFKLQTVNKIIFTCLSLLFNIFIIAQPAIQLGTQMDGFGFTDPVVQQLKVDYKRWIKTATSNGTEFLFHADSYLNKWTASTVSLNAGYTLNWGGGSYNPSSDGTLSSVTSGRTYTFKFRVLSGSENNDGNTNLPAIVMETSSVPVTLSSSAQSPAVDDVHQGQTVTVTLTLSGTPSSEENFFLRYSTDGFTSYGTLITPASGVGTSTQTFTIPSHPQNTTVEYYLLSSTLSGANLIVGEPFTDLATINFIRLSNSPPTNFSYTVLAALPVELTALEGRSTANNILLTWRTASEHNNSHFAVERSSDAHRWVSVGEVPGHGSTLEPQSYSFTDSQPLSGTNYYRLRQEDFDGNHEYSPVISVEFKRELPTVTFYPNPVSDELFFITPQFADDSITVRIFDPAGRLFRQSALQDNRLNVQDLPPGVYFIKLETGTRQVLLLERFVKY